MKTVKIIDSGEFYSTYEGFIDKYFTEYKKYWNYGTCPEDETRAFNLIGIANHEDDKDKKLALIQDPLTRKVYIYGCEGLKIDGISEKLPERYIINKDATILFWEDGSKTIVKRCEDDEYNKRLGFLTAYFQKHSGLSKNKANKYLANLVDDEAENEEYLKNILKDFKGNLVDYIEGLKKKAELGEHYKHLYSEIKKQKDDAIKFIHKELDRFDCEGSMSISMRISYFEEELLRMLGETDE